MQPANLPGRNGKMRWKTPLRYTKHDRNRTWSVRIVDIKWLGDKLIYVNISGLFLNL
jgi:hypothetical protein